MFISIKPHFFLEIGPNFLRGPHAWGLAFGLFDRGPNVPPGEYSLRLVVELGLYRPRRTWSLDRSPPAFSIYHLIVIIPAWWDEPTARAEYLRTMRR